MRCIECGNFEESSSFASIFQKRTNPVRDDNWTTGVRSHMALGQRAVEGGTIEPCFVGFECPSKRGATDFLDAQLDSYMVAKFEWRSVVDVERDDWPCG